MERISRAEFLRLFERNRGAEFVTIKSRTRPKLRQGAPWRDLVKTSLVNGCVNWHYTPAVNRQRVREGVAPDFRAYPRKWGERVTGGPFVSHRGKTYLEVKVEKPLGHSYESQGEPVPKGDVELYLRRPSASRQGVRREVILRDYNLDNILSVRMRGVEYVLTNE